MSNTPSSLAAFSRELSALVGLAAARTLSVTGAGRRPITATVVGKELAIGIHHVIDGDAVTVRTHDDRSFEATIAGRDDTRDLVLLRVPGLDVEALPFPSEPAATGDFVLSVSRSWQRRLTASVGIISSVGGSLRMGRLAVATDLLHADVSSTPGISGSPLVSAGGELVGIVNAGLARGVPLALPIAAVQQSVAALVEHGRIRRGFLGVGLQPIVVPASQHAAHRHGLIVVGLDADGPAAQAGLFVGDVIVSVDGEETSDARALQRRLSGHQVGTALSLGILRGRELTTVPVTVGERAH